MRSRRFASGRCPGMRSLAREADPEVAEKFERLSGAAANVSGIWHWLDKLEQPAG